jgi:mono/diheme cytochrome c family protein
MTMAVQPRHAKLGLGGQMRNWDYAAYESSELRNAFARIARTIPAYRGQAMATLFASTIKDPLDQLDAAVKSKDAARFDAAYGQVTQACNACHQALDHAFVVIKPPSGTPYPNQAFAP